MMKVLHGINHVFELDLGKPIGRRGRAVLLALLAVMIVGQARLFAQQQDCVGDYEKAVDGAFNDMMAKVTEAENNYSWYNPMRTVMVNAAGVEYYAKAESAMFQMLACSAFPMK